MLMKKLNANPSPIRKSYKSYTFEMAIPVTFGVPLKEVVDRDGTGIPLIVLDIFHFLINFNALKYEGIFRINGNWRTVETLRSMVDESGHNWCISDLTEISAVSERTVDAFSVASLLKLYLRELPGGLIPEDFTTWMIEAYLSNRNDRTVLYNRIMYLVGQLPVANHALLQQLCLFLNNVWSFREENKMSSEALGIVFGPNVFSVKSENENMRNQGVANRIMTVLIENTEYFFGISGPSNLFDLVGSGSWIPQKIRNGAGPRTSDKVCSDDDSNNHHSLDVDSPSHSTTPAGNKFLYPNGSTVDSHSSEKQYCLRTASFANKLNRCEFSPGLSAAIRCCINQHVLVGSRCTEANGDASLTADVNHPMNRSNDYKPDRFTLSQLSSTQYPPSNSSTCERETDSCTIQNTMINNGAHRFHVASSTLDVEASESLTQLTERLHQIRARIRDYERCFENERGHKPTLLEKKADSKVLALMENLSELRYAIKRLKMGPTQNEAATLEMSLGDAELCDSQTHVSSTGLDRFISVPGGAYSMPGRIPSKTNNGAVRSATLPRNSSHSSIPRSSKNTLLRQYTAEEDSPDELNTSIRTGDSEPSSLRPSMTRTSHAHRSCYAASLSSRSSTTLHKPDETLSETFAVLMHRLAEKRCSAKRPEGLHLMTRKQIEDEKLALQRALLYFESLHGRPSGRQERLIMRPLYDRYRTVKRILSSIPLSAKTSLVSSEPVKSADCDEQPVVSCDGDFGLDEQSAVNSTYVHSLTLPRSDNLPEVDAHMQPANNPNVSPHDKASKLNLLHEVPTGDSFTIDGLLADSAQSGKRDSKHSRRNGDGNASLSDTNWCHTKDLQNPLLFQSTTNENLCHSDGSFTVHTKLKSDLPEHNFLHAFHVKPSSDAICAGVDSSEEPQDGCLQSVPSSKPTITAGNVGFPTTTSDLNVYKVGTSASVDGNSLHLRDTHSSTDGFSRGKRNDQESNNNGDPSDWPLARLQSELQLVRESKRQLQKILKDFEHHFEQNKGHKVERVDRLCMRTEYNQYKILKTRLSVLETELQNRFDR